MQSLTWTSPRPFGVGTTREVVLPLSSLMLREEFFRWDEGVGYSFFGREANRPLFTRFAENYVLEPDGSGTLFTWTVAIEPRPKAVRLMKALGPMNKASFGQQARGATTYFARHP